MCGGPENPNHTHTDCVTLREVLDLCGPRGHRLYLARGSCCVSPVSHSASNHGGGEMRARAGRTPLCRLPGESGQAEFCVPVHGLKPLQEGDLSQLPEEPV